MACRLSTYHVHPLGDQIEHNLTGDDCVCGPATQPVEREDGSIGWLIIHHSLDGRELTEPRNAEDAPRLP